MTMITIDVPGFGRLELAHLVVDYNGTLAMDGRLLGGVAERLSDLATSVGVHVITADTFGLVEAELAGLPVGITILATEAQAEAKRDFVSRLGADAVAAIGNGRNDRHMLRAAALGIAVVQREGMAAEAAASADVISPSIVDALDLLQHPKRLVATLRS